MRCSRVIEAGRKGQQRDPGLPRTRLSRSVYVGSGLGFEVRDMAWRREPSYALTKLPPRFGQTPMGSLELVDQR